MDFDKEFDELANRLKRNDWFYDVSLDKYGRVVVYALWIDGDVMIEVPSILCGRQVLLHFSNKKLSEKPDIEVQDSTDEPLNLLELTNKLDKLEKVCGTNILESIFYEEHDGKNAVTNWSNKFPEVRKVMHDLYSKYGFDMIYNELEISL